MDNVINVYNETISMKTEEYFKEVLNILKEGQKFVKYCDEVILKNVTVNRYQEYGYSVDELKEIAKYFGIELSDSMAEIDVNLNQFIFEISKPLFDDDKEIKRKIYVGAKSSRYSSFKVNMALSIYLNLLLTDDKIYHKQSFIAVADNTISVEFFAKIFVIPMLCRTEEYLKTYKNYVEDLEKTNNYEKFEKYNSLTYLFNLAVTASVPIDMAVIIDLVYSKLLQNEKNQIEGTFYLKGNSYIKCLKKT